jgi:hypothetical protein
VRRRAKNAPRQFLTGRELPPGGHATKRRAVLEHPASADSGDCANGRSETTLVIRADSGIRWAMRPAQVNLISDALPFGRLWYVEPNAISSAVGSAKFYSRSHDAVIRVYDEAGNVIETHEHAGEFKEW